MKRRVWFVLVVTSTLLAQLNPNFVLSFAMSVTRFLPVSNVLWIRKGVWID